MCRQQGSPIVLADNLFLYEFSQMPCRKRIQAAGGLVQKYYGRVGQEPAGDCKALFHPGRKVAEPAVCILIKLGNMQYFINTAFLLGEERLLRVAKNARFCRAVSRQ